MTEASEKKELQSTEETPETPVQEDKTRHDPVHQVTKIMLYTALTLFILYLVTDRLAPWTDQARVQTYIVPIVPQVAGNVIKINVEKDQIVNSGDILFKIDPSDYQLALESAESALELAGQEIGASTASVTTAQAKVVEAQINLEYVKTQSKRVFELEKDNILPVSDGDKARAAIDQAKTLVVSARAELEKSKQQLGQEGNDNPKIRSAIAALKKAQIDLSRTTVIAPTKGGITNLIINEGQYASVGAPLMTFVDFESVWVNADFRENSIANIKVGDSVDLALDVRPGKIYKGKVSSIGFAVDDASTGAAGQLVTVKGKTGWLRDSQRFPVTIKFLEDNYPRGLLRVGGQVDAQVYTGNNFIINSFGWLWIRVLTWISYVY
ncbi:MAG: HlyD family secretion protein [gamma proteobacterium symbiont of Taylorina sp.]|nr:HlyD family secretion protein [gamma proteobacterium symbiont of Taylorina sp.]